MFPKYIIDNQSSPKFGTLYYEITLQCAVGEFKGSLSLKLKTKFIPFLTFKIAKGAKFKRGKAREITWETSTPGKLNLELYHGKNKVTDLTALSTATSFNWSIPKEIELGAGYKIKASGNGRYAFSEPFAIKRKMPLVLWIVSAVAVIGGTVAIIAGRSNGGEDNKYPNPLDRIRDRLQIGYNKFNPRTFWRTL